MSCGKIKILKYVSGVALVAVLVQGWPIQANGQPLEKLYRRTPEYATPPLKGGSNPAVMANVSNSVEPQTLVSAYCPEPLNGSLTSCDSPKLQFSSTSGLPSNTNSTVTAAIMPPEVNQNNKSVALTAAPPCPLGVKQNATAIQSELEPQTPITRAIRQPLDLANARSDISGLAIPVLLLALNAAENGRSSLNNAPSTGAPVAGQLPDSQVATDSTGTQRGDTVAQPILIELGQSAPDGAPAGSYELPVSGNFSNLEQPPQVELKAARGTGRPLSENAAHSPKIDLQPQADVGYLNNPKNSGYSVPALFGNANAGKVGKDKIQNIQPLNEDNLGNPTRVGAGYAVPAKEQWTRQTGTPEVQSLTVGRAVNFNLPIRCSTRTKRKG